MVSLFEIFKHLLKIGSFFLSVFFRRILYLGRIRICDKHRIRDYKINQLLVTHNVR